MNAGYKYILVVINAGRKYFWCEPVKNKTRKTKLKQWEKFS